VFVSLSLAGVMMVSLALSEMTRFVADSDRVAAAFSGNPAAFAERMPVHVGKTQFTNVTAGPAQRTVGYTVTPGRSWSFGRQR
jgi:hypothetical protein